VESQAALLPKQFWTICHPAEQQRINTACETMGTFADVRH
jgi:hypothetical protein